jgi:hypothetical protein
MSKDEFKESKLNNFKITKKSIMYMIYTFNFLTNFS